MLQRLALLGVAAEEVRALARTSMLVRAVAKLPMYTLPEEKSVDEDNMR